MMYEFTTTTQTPTFSPDEERRYTALCLAVAKDAKGDWPVEDIIGWARVFEAYLRGKEEEEG